MAPRSQALVSVLCGLIIGSYCFLTLNVVARDEYRGNHSWVIQDLQHFEGQIKAYRLTHGRYPDSWEDLHRDNSVDEILTQLVLSDRKSYSYSRNSEGIEVTWHSVIEGANGKRYVIEDLSLSDLTLPGYQVRWERVFVKSHPFAIVFLTLLGAVVGAGLSRHAFSRASKRNLASIAIVQIIYLFFAAIGTSVFADFILVLLIRGLR